jgi:hypothetical protein
MFASSQSQESFLPNNWSQGHFIIHMQQKKIANPLANRNEPKSLQQHLKRGETK